MTIARLARCVTKFIIALRRHHRDRRLLANLNERELRDIGIDRCEINAVEEGSEPWRWGSHP